MAESFLLYYITDRSQFPGDETSRRQRLLDKIAEAARGGVDFIQLREKDFSTRELELLALDAICIIRDNTPPLEAPNAKPATRLLINSRTDVALACGADGVHLRSHDISPAEVQEIWSKGGAGTLARETKPRPVIGVSCHTPAEVARAAAADFAVFAPVFEKKDSPDTRPAGLEGLRQACQHKTPVLALGGVTLANARSCLEAGAAGIAAIRLFQENDVREIIESLRD